MFLLYTTTYEIAEWNLDDQQPTPKSIFGVFFGQLMASIIFRVALWPIKVLYVDPRFFILTIYLSFCTRCVGGFMQLQPKISEELSYAPDLDQLAICGANERYSPPIGMISNKMSKITIFSHKNFIIKFTTLIQILNWITE